MKPVKLGLLGVGTVGASTALVLKNNAAEIARRAGRNIEIIQASRRDVSAGMPAGSGDIELCADPFTVVNNPEIDIVIELIGGYGPAFELVMQAIENGKHVVTANKALIA
ncbi:MAG: homoserine dehydrogenase, partial [Gammaproteobacteria bacterium]